MARKRIYRLTTYDKTINRLCLLHNCSMREAKNIYERRVKLKLLPE